MAASSEGTQSSAAPFGAAHDYPQPPAHNPLETPAAEAGRGVRLLCAIDGSDGSMNGLKFLVEKLVVRERGDSVVLVTACKPCNPELVPLFESQGDVIHEEEERRSRDRMQKLGELSKEVPVPCQTTVLSGDPGWAIPKFIAEQPVDVVVVGSRGMSKVDR
ncbi:universal stress protein family protein [Klebsormidium nitens]|uniref:Universal stress protein family protein n=1 Tax=Klebsormidium nitens TaxID=105231 RepID=A0A1Y1HMM8_KLENI|nr:universal stress protein family protein [Klebsormidium nitens]|eukprot:GAQ79263.1 universal stress protein family protein [Klebsormidium nitens]